MKNYTECEFKLKLPKAITEDKNAIICLDVMRKKAGIGHVVLSEAKLTDRVGNVFESQIDIMLDDKKYNEHIKFKIWSQNKRIYVNGARLLLLFLSGSGNKTYVYFKFSSSETYLEEVDVQKMEKEDWHRYDVVCKSILEEQNTYVQEEKIDDFVHKNVGVTGNDIPDLEKYKKALVQEKIFLKNAGGKKCKVTSGRMIGRVNGKYAYFFEMESELYIADDSPVVLKVSESSIDGTVLMCEEFQIIILLDRNIGDTVASARISVEPWKLLEMLENRLDRVVRLSNSMSKKLLTEGPKLATREPIENIKKGQDEVIKRAKNEPVTIVWGPPGTGKTHTMSELAIDFLKSGKNVLIVSHSNVSVDGVAAKIYKFLEERKENDIYENGKVLRYGYIRNEELQNNKYVSSFKYAVAKNQNLNEELEKLQAEYNEIKNTVGLKSQRILEIHTKISQIRSKIADEEQKYVSNAYVVATTISKVVMDKIFDDRVYDVVMFDEVSMAYVLQVVCAATYAKEHMICVGDFMQLAPIAQSEAKNILCEDIFTYLGINVNGTPYYHPWLVMLNEQRRMHPAISEFSKENIYHKLLENHESVYWDKDIITDKEPFSGKAINFVDLTGTYSAASKNQDNSRYNILSAAVSFGTAIQLEKELKKVSIITPYAAHTRLVRAMIQDYKEANNKTNIRCATVHQFQGSESDAIVFDAVESYPGQKVGFLLGKDMNAVKRLINVAVTRAEGKLVTVSNGKFWENGFKDTKHTFYLLQKYLKDNGNRICHKDNSLENLVESFELGKMMTIYTYKNNYWTLFEKDIKDAKERIIISLPSAKISEDVEENLYRVIKEAKEKGIEVIVKSKQSGELPKRWQVYSKASENAIFPLVIIDDKLTWYGVPEAEWKFEVGKGFANVTVCNIVWRMKGKYTTEMIKSLTDIEATEEVEFIEETNDKYNLAMYIKEKIRCENCKSVVKMTRGKSGKLHLKCIDCKHTQLLDKNELNNYIFNYNVTCPMHKFHLKAGLGQFGLYVRCDVGHFIKPEEI